MQKRKVRAALLATSSVLGLVLAAGGAARAAPVPCAFNNQPGGVDNAGPINCISYNNGTNNIGNIVNEASGAITATTPYPPLNAGTSTGISVVVAGTTLTGSITNAGAIAAPQYGINIGAGSHGSPATQIGIGASVTGSITNNGTIQSGYGIIVRESNVGGSLINNNTITSVGVGLYVTGVIANGASIGGSVVNNGTIAPSQPAAGISVNFASVGGSVSNNGTIISTGFSAIGVVNGGEVAGSIINTGTLTDNNTSDNIGIYVGEQTVGHSVVNAAGGTITAGFGIAITGSSGNPAIVGGNVANSGTITAKSKTGIALFNVTVGGAVINTSTIMAARNGIRVVNTTGSVAGATVAGGITNRGTITSTGSGFAGIALVGATVSQGVSNSGTITATNGAGIRVNNSSAVISAVNGGVANQGTIAGMTGVVVSGGSVLAGGITNSGNITGSRAAIDLATIGGGEGAAMTINQQAGTITGNILLSSLGDTANITGGSIAGNIVGTGSSGTVNFALGGNAFAYSNAITGVSAVNVNSGTLFDNNSITAGTVKVNGGALAPGLPSTAGTLTITGNLVFAAAAAYLITINGASASKAGVTGTAVLGGASVKLASGSQINFSQTYTILTATGGVSGTFNPTVTFGSMNGSLTYDANDVFLTFRNSKITPVLPPGAPQNVLNVAGAIDNFIATGGTLPAGFVNLFNFTPPQLVNALTQLSGEAATGAQASAFQLMTSFLGLLTGPFGSTGDGGGPALPFAPERADTFPSDVALAYASVLKALPLAYAPHWTAWGAAFGGSSTTSGDPSGVGSHDATARAGGFAAGMDYHAAPDTIVGFALAGGGSSWSLSAGLGDGRSDVFLAGLYGSKQWGQAYLSGAFTYASYWMSTSRSIAIAATDTLTTSFNAQDFGGRIEGGYRVASLAALSVIPYAAVQAQRFWSPAYSESGSLGTPDPFALSFAAQSATAVRAELGSRFDQVLMRGGGSSVDLFGRLAWAHDWQSNPNLSATFIGLPAATFVVNGAAPPTDLALVTAGAEWRLPDGWSLLAKFDGEFARGSDTYSGTARVKYSW
jgi:uncharacterized protein with beta-barrel porin domain